MIVTLQYTGEVKTPFEEVFFQDIANRILHEAEFAFLSDKKIVLNAVAVTAEKIQKLNEAYRNKDAVTDILSFGEYIDVDVLKKETREEIFLGELFFCPEFIEKAAEEDGIAIIHEMIYVFSHGVLHLLGFDHSDEMFAIQDRVTEKVVLDSRAER